MAFLFSLMVGEDDLYINRLDKNYFDQYNDSLVVKVFNDCPGKSNSVRTYHVRIKDKNKTYERSFCNDNIKYSRRSNINKHLEMLYSHQHQDIISTCRTYFSINKDFSDDEVISIAFEIGYCLTYIFIELNNDEDFVKHQKLFDTEICIPYSGEEINNGLTCYLTTICEAVKETNEKYSASLTCSLIISFLNLFGQVFEMITVADQSDANLKAIVIHNKSIKKYSKVIKEQYDKFVNIQQHYLSNELDRRFDNLKRELNK